MSIKRTFKRATIDEANHLTVMEEDTWEVHFSFIPNKTQVKSFFRKVKEAAQKAKEVFNDPLSLCFKNGLIYAC